MRLKLKKREGNGEAYALLRFKNEQKTEDIEKELNGIHKNKEEYGVHPKLYIYAGTTDDLSGIHPDLEKHATWDYIIKAILPGKPNEEAAKELSHATNQLYKGLESYVKPSDDKADYENEDTKELRHAANEHYHEVIYLKHGKVHYEDKEKYHHLRKKQKVY